MDPSSGRILARSHVKSKAVNMKRVKPAEVSSPKITPVVTDIVRHYDIEGHLLEPGDCVFRNVHRYLGHALYVGKGYVVHYDRHSKTVVKERIGVTYHVTKLRPHMYRNLKVSIFPPEVRIQRVTSQIGRACPVKDGGEVDLMYWAFFGINFKEGEKDIDFMYARN